MAYPVAYDVEPQLHDRDRLTVFFRIILAIPHLILVGGPAFALGCGWGFHWGTSGFPGVVAGVMAIIARFAILFTSTHPRGLWDFARYFMFWRARAVAYMALLRDDYPPFGEGTYPAIYGVAYPDMPWNKWSAGLRIFYVIPHIVVLFFVGIAWFITTVIAWFAILFTGCTRQASTHSPSATCAGRCESSPTYCSCATNTQRSRSSRSARETPRRRLAARSSTMASSAGKRLVSKGRVTGAEGGRRNALVGPARIDYNVCQLASKVTDHGEGRSG